MYGEYIFSKQYRVPIYNLCMLLSSFIKHDIIFIEGCKNFTVRVPFLPRTTAISMAGYISGNIIGSWLKAYFYCSTYHLEGSYVRVYHRKPTVKCKFPYWLNITLFSFLISQITVFSISSVRLLMAIISP